MHTVIKKLTRFLLLGLCFWLPAERRIHLERWLRGREEFHKLQLADCVVVSFGKSGRTWLRVLLSRFYQLKHDLPEHSLIGFDNLHRKNPAIPRIFFTHDNYLKDYTGNADSKKDYYGKNALLAGDSNWYWAPNGVYDGGVFDNVTYNSPSPALLPLNADGNLAFSYQSTEIEAWLTDTSLAKKQAKAQVMLGLPGVTASYYRDGSHYVLVGTNTMTKSEKKW